MTLGISSGTNFRSSFELNCLFKLSYQIISKTYFQLKMSGTKLLIVIDYNTILLLSEIFRKIINFVKPTPIY